MNILYIFTDSKEEWNSTEWRSAIPYRVINEKYPDTYRAVHVNDFVDGSSRDLQVWADLVIIERLMIGLVVNEMLLWQSMGSIFVVDLDDAYGLMTKDNPAHPFWIKGRVSADGKPVYLDEAPIKTLTWGLKLVNGITSPSRVILSDWKKIGIDGWFVPNFLNYPVYAVPPMRNPDKLRIGWGGSMSHFNSWVESGAAKGVARAILRAKRPCEIAICGNDKRILKSFFSFLGEDQKVQIEHVPHNVWPRKLATFDIGLAPLGGSYDDRRSNLKLQEYAVMGIPCILSNKPPYQGNDEIFSGLLVKNDANSWEHAVTEMINDIDHWRHGAEAKKPFAISRYAAQYNADVLLHSYENIVAQFSTKGSQNG